MPSGAPPPQSFEPTLPGPAPFATFLASASSCARRDRARARFSKSTWAGARSRRDGLRGSRRAREHPDHQGMREKRRGNNVHVSRGSSRGARPRGVRGYYTCRLLYRTRLLPHLATGAANTHHGIAPSAKHGAAYREPSCRGRPKTDARQVATSTTGCDDIYFEPSLVSCRPALFLEFRRSYSTVTLLARLRGWSTSHPRRMATSRAKSCSGTVAVIGSAHHARQARR